jgi:flagellin-like protein
MKAGLRRAVSPVVATLMMVAAAISIGTLAYWYVTSYVRATSQIPSLTIDAVALNYTGGASIQVNLRNAGTTSIAVKRLLITHDKGTLPRQVDIDLPAGGTYSLTETSIFFTPGRSYGIVVETSMGNLTSTVPCMRG